MNRPIDGVDLDGLEWTESTHAEGYNQQISKPLSKFTNPNETNNLPTNNGTVVIGNEMYSWVGKDLYYNSKKAKYSTTKPLFKENWEKVTFEAKAFHDGTANSDATMLQILGPQGSSLLLTANEHGVVELPVTSTSGDNSGDGEFTLGGRTFFEVYNRNDANNAAIGDQYAEPHAIANMFNAIVEYTGKYRNDIIQIGEMKSSTNGRTFVDPYGNTHHGDPNAFDIRLLGRGGSYQGYVSDPRFSISRTQAFINALSNFGFPRMFIGASVAPSLKAPKGFSIIGDSPVHDHHMHVDTRQ